MHRVDLAPPAHLSEPARAVWQVAIATLADGGLLDHGVLPALERYAVQWARWREAEAQLAGEGIIIAAPGSGVRMVNPWHSIARAAAAQCTKLETELGLSPARRRSAQRAARPLQADGMPAPPSASDLLLMAGNG